jgi:hypothetical protein
MFAVLAVPGRFLFRREKKSSEGRDAAMDEVFDALRRVIASASTLKPEWIEAWERRSETELPPKYRADQYLYPGAVDAAVDAKYTRGLLYQNRWNSQMFPLFENFDPETWTQVRATIERASAVLASIREAHFDAFSAEEVSWLRRAIEGIEVARGHLREAERTEKPAHEVVAVSTFQALYSVLQLSETMLDGLRREAREK